MNCYFVIICIDLFESGLNGSCMLCAADSYHPSVVSPTNSGSSSYFHTHGTRTQVPTSDTVSGNNSRSATQHVSAMPQNMTAGHSQHGAAGQIVPSSNYHQNPSSLPNTSRQRPLPVHSVSVVPALFC